MTDTPAKDEKTGRFLTGNIGGGRKKGSRNKLGEEFLQDMLEAWQAQGKEVIARVIEERPQDFMKVVASLLPRDVNLNVNSMEEVTDDELLQRIRDLDATIRPFLDAQGAAGTRQGTGAPTAH